MGVSFAWLPQPPMCSAAAPLRRFSPVRRDCACQQPSAGTGRDVPESQGGQSPGGNRRGDVPVVVQSR